jgi:hypothetical protein
MHGIVLVVRDIEQSVVFYMRCANAVVLRQHDSFTTLNVGDMALHLVSHDEPAPSPTITLSLAVTSLEGLTARIRDLGGMCGGETWWFERDEHLRATDPDGYVLEFFQHHVDL